MAIIHKGKQLVKDNDNKKSLQGLAKNEIEILLTMIGASSFQGKNLEMVYNLVVKLQDKYLELVALDSSKK